MKNGNLALDLSGIGGALSQGEKLQDAVEQNEELRKRILELEEQIARIGVEGLEKSIDEQFKGSEKIISVPISQIAPYPGQPRKTFSPESLRILKKTDFYGWSRRACKTDTSRRSTRVLALGWRASLESGSRIRLTRIKGTSGADARGLAYCCSKGIPHSGRFECLGSSRSSYTKSLPII